MIEYLTVKDLREFIHDLDDDIPIYLCGKCICGELIEIGLDRLGNKPTLDLYGRGLEWMSEWMQKVIIMKRNEDGSLDESYYNANPDEFWKDFFADECITVDDSNEDKIKMMTGLAYEYGHANGFEDILNYAYDLVELIR